ncbi:hypothetical protein ACQEVZ_20330 [Dactylosporangium sp. CA-152071]|uniref:hypothetical protein n=1 Tax=Dactylosporangium sp. CA-152071 TaxID=3239933 RepID=UPI003D8FF4CA
MDPAIVTALIAAGGGLVAGGGVAAPVVIHILSRRQRDAQADESAARTEQLEAQTEEIRQRLTRDLHADLERVQSSLRTTSAEAEQLRQRVLDLESRVAQLTRDEARASEELQRVQRERDQLRADLAARNATIVELRAQVTTLTLQASLAQPPH